MGGRFRVATLAAAVAIAAAACGKSASDVTAPESTPAPATGSEASSSATTGSETTAGGITGMPPGTDTVLTPPATGPVDRPLVWGTYRETNTLDPIFAFDYPENTAISALCDTLLRQAPDGTLGPGLAETYAFTDPTTLVLDLRTDVTFWDGTPLTAADVVFNLKRQADPKGGGFYTTVFARVSSIEATGPSQVTIKLTQPDAWLLGELGGTPGYIAQPKYIEAKGKEFGTVNGGTMCTGPFKLDSWKTGEGVTIVKNDAYWDTTLKPQAAKITIKGIPDDAAITSGFLTGELNGLYISQISTLDQLKAASDKVSVYQGGSYGSDAFIVSNFTGALGDAKVRRALSMAIDRVGLIAANYKGGGIPARALANPGSYGYARQTFVDAWNALPEPAVDIEGAKALVEEAGATGKTIRIGMSNELPTIVTSAAAFKSAAEQIGLKAELVSTSAANYINFFIDPKAREAVDGFFTINYPDYADPAALYNTLALKEGSQNYSGYENAEVTRLLNEARGELDDEKRAELVVQAQALITEDVPWIPVVSPITALIMSSDLTGPPATFQYMFGPALAYLGAK